MNIKPETAGVLRAAREASGLSQRQLAVRAGTTQAVVARIESGKVAPNWETLTRLLRETGHEVDLRVYETPVVAPEWLDEADRIRAMTPSGRMRELSNAASFFARARRIG